MDKREYIKIGNARDLADSKERRLYRFFEILPGLLTWGTLLGVIFLSWASPVFIAFFIIAFDIYWLLKTLFLSLHLRSCFAIVRRTMKKDWLAELEKENGFGDIRWQNIYHLVILPMYKENYGVVSETFESLMAVNYPKDKIIVVLAIEERGGRAAAQVAKKITKKYSNIFFKFLVTVHPQDIVGEIAGKGSNETWAIRQVKEKIIDKLDAPYENILVSVFDVDTVVYPEYFACLTHVFLKTNNRTYCSFQPIPVFNNNIWDAPSFSRVVAQSGTFWHMMQQERPERLATFSSHSMNFKILVEMDFWSTKNVSEDSRIFWQSLLFYDSKYRVVPLYYPVSMDANLAKNWWQTAVNVYKQQRRWGWGVENIPFVLFGFWQNKKIPLKTKVFWAFNHMEGFWSWGTNALIIFMLGWLPLFLGGQEFNVTLLSYNLPQITRVIMTLAMVGLVSSAIYGTILLPPRPERHSPYKYLFMIVQWILLPVTIIIFGSLPGLEAQTRLMLGKYMGFWVTPKVRQQR
jgi:cellulose synthase/poly-beta-1,6-N-acetylglucosamine synthase-like glycosyltransferase